MANNLRRSRPADVLLVGDNENDVILMQESLIQSKLTVNLHHVVNGKECMTFLRREGNYADVPTPDLILLDLNMPIMDGRKVLAEISKDDSLNHIPVVILTTSEDEQDVLTMYKLRCSSSITKPVDFDQFEKLIEQLSHYWFSVVVLPPNGNPSPSRKYTDVRNRRKRDDSMGNFGLYRLSIFSIPHLSRLSETCHYGTLRSN